MSLRSLARLPLAKHPNHPYVAVNGDVDAS
jgi:hypothetical protein